LRQVATIAVLSRRGHISPMQSDSTFDERRAARDEREVRGRFWEKARRTLGLVPFLEDAVAAFYCAVDPKTPGMVRATLFGALAYFILPFDALPDFVAALGFTDDLAVLLAAYRAVGTHVTEEHRQRAREAVERLRGGEMQSGQDAAV
jgi:uncharacterized membrane protein YkvA (DUF1232 family)